MRKFTCALCSSCVLGVASAAPFTNLGFDDQTVYPVSSHVDDAPVGDLLPSWRLFYGPLERQSLGLNFLPLSSPSASVIAWSSLPWTADPPFGLHFLTDQPNAPYTLVQSAELPDDAAILSLDFQYVAFGIAINGEPVKVLNPGEWSEMGFSQLPERAMFDVSEFAGQTVELRITQLTVATGRAESFLDNIRIDPIPEPSIGLLCVVGCLGPFVYAVRRKRLLPCLAGSDLSNVLQFSSLVHV